MMDAPSKSQNNVLRNIFSNVMKVSDYVLQITSGRLLLAKDGDEEAFLTFLDSLYLVPEESPKQVVAIQKDAAPIKEILQRLISHIVRNQSTGDSRSVPILALGYRLARWSSVLSMRSDVDIECYYINTVHSYILTSNWQLIANRAGEAITRRILLQRLFLASNNGCFVQISGMPMKDHVFTQKTASISGPGNEALGKTCIPRGGLLYNRKYNKSPGLPKSHILCKRQFSPLNLLKDIFPTLSLDTLKTCDLLSDQLNEIKERYLKIDFCFLLNMHCRISRGETSLEGSNKRKRRGCRGGKRKKKLVESSNSDLYTSVGIQTPTALEKVRQKIDSSGMPLILQRAVQNFEIDAKVIEEGICSQNKDCYEIVGRGPDDFRLDDRELQRYEEQRDLSQKQSICSSLEANLNTSSCSFENENGSYQRSKERDTFEQNRAQFVVSSPLTESLSADSGTNHYIQSNLFQIAGV